MNSLLSLKLANWSRTLLNVQAKLAPPVDVSVRYKSRRGTRLKRAAIKARIKAQKASMPKQEPKLTFMQKVTQDLMKGRLPPETNIYGDTTTSSVSQDLMVDKSSLSLTWPSRLLRDETNAERSQDDVFQINHFDCKVPIEQAVVVLRQIYDKTIYDDPKAPVNIRLDLNMNLDIEKKEMIENFKDMFVLPHPFEFGKRRVVMAFSRDPNAQMAARDAGAEFVGGTEIIRKIKRGEFKIDEVDYFVANIDVVDELGGIRGLLKDKMPTQTNGLLGLDVLPLVRHYRNAITVEVNQDEKRQDWGVCNVIIGRLDMQDEHLAANAGAIIGRLCQRRPLAASLGHFVHRAALVAAERRVFVEWAFEPFAPAVPDNDSALQAMADAESGKKTKRKKRKKVSMITV